ncbi:MAG: HAMP domain-containing protein [Chloroflexota bacterium]
MHTLSKEVIEVDVQLSRVAHNIAIATLQCRRYEKDVFLNLNDTTARANYVSLWQDAYNDLERSIADFNTLAKTEPDRNQGLKWQEDISRYRTAFFDVEQSIEVGQITTSDAANQAIDPFKETIRDLTDSATAVAISKDEEAYTTNQQLDAIGLNTARTTSILGVSAILIALVWSLLFPARFVRPLVALQQATKRLSDGDFDTRVTIQRRDEFGQLADGFNQMADTIKTQVVELDQTAVVHKQNEQLQALLHLVQELETPAVPLLDGVLLVPLVGYLDARRAQRISDVILQTAHTHKAQIVIVDITGISGIDTPTAQYIQQLAMSLQLLGARVLLTGITASVAQTIIELNISFQDITTYGSLQDGVAEVLQQVAYRRLYN